MIANSRKLKKNSLNNYKRYMRLLTREDLKLGKLGYREVSRTKQSRLIRLEISSSRLTLSKKGHCRESLEILAEKILILLLSTRSSKIKTTLTVNPLSTGQSNTTKIK